MHMSGEREQPCHVCTDLLDSLSSTSDELSRMTLRWLDGGAGTGGGYRAMAELARLAELRARSAVIRSRYRAHCATAHAHRVVPSFD